MKTARYRFRSIAARTAPIALTLCAAIACAPDGATAFRSGERDVSADAPSQATRIDQPVPSTNGALSVALQSVEQDSRCPRSVTCVRMGDVALTLTYRLGTGPATPLSLRWGAPPSDTVIAGFRVILDSVTPWPSEETGPMAPELYTAWVTLKPQR